MSTIVHAPAIGKASWSVTLANQKALKATQRAEQANAAVKAARKRVLEEMMNVDLSSPVAARPRTSTKAFATKEPAHQLAALGRVDIDADMTAYEFPLLDAVAYKYSVRTLSERLAVPFEAEEAMYDSARAAAMMASATLRTVYDVAVEMATANPETHEEARRMLLWHGPQAMIQGRATRGVGVVAMSEAAKGLMAIALATAKERVMRLVEAGVSYERQMAATAAIGEV